MNLLQQLQIATQEFLKRAYPDGAPEAVGKKIEALGAFTDQATLLKWAEFEVEGSRYNLRLGNLRYPHMKMVFLLEDHHPVFYVDAHDSHFSLPPGMPGYDQLLALRKQNMALKMEIERAWAARQLTIFGAQTSKIGAFKKICEGMSVLAIDDEVQILEMLGIIVTSLGATFHRATSADEAREVLDDHGSPTLVLCDIIMPGESGYDFIKWFKQHYKDVPVYFITGQSMEQNELDDLAEVLQKPFSAKSVMKIMKNQAIKKPGKKNAG